MNPVTEILQNAAHELRAQSQMVTPSVLALRSILDQIHNALHRSEEIQPPSFETAEDIVKARMAKARDEMKAQGFSPYLLIAIADFEPTWTIYTDSNLRDSFAAPTLAGALAKIASPKTSEEIKAERRAALIAELEELTGEEVRM